MMGESAEVDELIAIKDTIFSSALRQNPVLTCFFCSTGSGDVVGHLEKLVAANCERLEKLNLFSEIAIEFLGAKSLQESYRAATNSISEKIEFPRSITLPDHESVEQAHVGYIAADQLLRLVTRQSNDGANARMNPSVFFDNIRDFNPNSKINQGIITELSDGDTSSFVFKNNGVTVVAKNVSRTGDRFTLDDYQIVNGCQTTNILFHCRDKIDGVFVPVRIIGTDDPEFVASIIVGTNNQNEVKEEQFWALKPFLKDLEEYSRNQDGERRIYVERRENQFREENVERTRIIKPRDLMKAIAGMFLFRPHRAARDYRGIRKEFEDVIFQENHSVEIYHTAALAAYKFDFVTRNQRVESSWKIYKYYVLFSLGARATKGTLVFSMKRKLQSEICGEILITLLDEPNFVKFVESVAELLDKMIAERKLDTREQVRDALRSDSFAKEFSQKFGLGNFEF
jgi:hypothetical protein